ncbi:ANKRD50 [Symbiodinium natans]|uniref:ANKRD50 protein n=1 Tax=Symbiodinium natans TaxID=878477 RepID=A0A812JNC7_9DINO|nr:ANKRD50 [Symbiodinium natans]
MNCATPCKLHTQLSSEWSPVLKQRLEGLAEVKTWYDTVKCGSNVFKTPAAFPPNFCRVAAALKKRLGLRCAGSLLDFVSFFEFNRRRPIYPLAWHSHTHVNLFGRPIAPYILEADALLRHIGRRAEGEEEAEGGDSGKKPAEEVNNTTCWAELFRKRGYDDED